MIALSSMDQTVHAIRRAHEVTFSAYVLRSGATFDALCSAAKSGARVRVRLEANPYADDGALSAENEQAVATLRTCGADAQLDRGSSAQRGYLHLKAAVCDGVAYLDDRNWAADGTQTIVRDDFASDARAVKEAILNRSGYDRDLFATQKQAALRDEARLIRSARSGDTVDVESESFSGSAVSVALREAAQRGVHCRLQVAARDVKQRELSQLRHLQANGVDVRLSNSDEKMAVLNGRRAWVGSANATFGSSTQRDWGLRTNAPAVADHLESDFNVNWRAAIPLSP